MEQNNDAGLEDQTNNVGDIITCKRNLTSANTIHLKYVDDLTIAEEIKLKESLTPQSVEQRVQPYNYHDRTGHILPDENSQVCKQIESLNTYTNQNDMAINFIKTKSMLFNPCKLIDFTPKLKISGSDIEAVEEIRLLGLVIRSDLKWSSNTDS